MKKSLFIAIFCLVSIGAKAESLYPTVTPSTSEEAYTLGEGIRYKTVDGEAFEKTYMIGKVQEIDGKTYATCYAESRTIVQNGTGWNYSYDNGWETLYFRQEGDRVYWLPKEGEEEVLVLDYSLNIGDKFVSADGERFQVTETGYVGEEYEGRVIYNKTNEVAPRQLRLVSEESDKEDLWVEGIGSLNWGIVPYCAVQNMKNVDGMPCQSTVFYKTKGSVNFLQNINEEYYKQVTVPRPEDEHKYRDEDAHLDYEFVGDTLHIHGTYSFQNDDGYYFFEFMTDKDNNIAYNIWSPGFWEYLTTGKCLPIDVRIPGYKAGVYKIWNISTHQECILVCSGTNAINEIENEKRGNGENEKAIYDLSGRKISGDKNSNFKIKNSKLQKGIYIQDGKKVVRK